MSGRAQLICDLDERWDGPPPRCQRMYFFVFYDKIIFGDLKRLKVDFQSKG